MNFSEIDFFKTRLWKMISFGPHFGGGISIDGKSLYVWGFDENTSEYVEPRKFDLLKKSTDLFEDIQCSESEIFVKTKQGIIYKICAGSCWSKLEQIKFPDNRRVKKMSVGVMHSGFITTKSIGSLDEEYDKSMELVMMGDSSYGQRGVLEKANFCEMNVIRIQGGVKDVCCGGRHTLIKTSENKLYVLGDDSCLQLGLGDTRFYGERGGGFEPGIEGFGYKPRTGNEKFPDISRHKFSFYDKHYVHEPIEVIHDWIVNSDFDFSMTAGKDFSVLFRRNRKNDEIHSVVAESGAVVAFGENEHGQCGRAKGRHHQTLMEVKGLLKLNENLIKCGTSHCISCCCLENQVVLLGWGEGRRGQLGRGLGRKGDVCPAVEILRLKEKGSVEFFSASFDNSVVIVSMS